MFKVGDWITTPHRGTFQIVHEVELSSWEITLGGKAKLWQPQPDEWVWYGFELVQVIDATTDHIKICRQKSDSYEEVDASVLEPFIGQLPTIAKD